MMCCSSKSPTRWEVSNDAGRRWRWSPETKARFVAESYATSDGEVADSPGCPSLSSAGRRLRRLSHTAGEGRRTHGSLLGPRPAPLLRIRRRGSCAIASEAIQRIGDLYAVRATSAVIRLTNGAPSASLQPIGALEPPRRVKLEIVSQEGQLTGAIRTGLSRWEGLSRYLDECRVAGLQRCRASDPPSGA